MAGEENTLELSAQLAFAFAHFVTFCGNPNAESWLKCLMWL
jgi:hypothetical protein